MVLGEYEFNDMFEGRTDGNIYKFDAQTGQELGSTNLVSSGSVRTGGIDSFTPPCDADCCD